MTTPYLSFTHSLGLEVWWWTRPIINFKYFYYHYCYSTTICYQLHPDCYRICRIFNPNNFRFLFRIIIYLPTLLRLKKNINNSSFIFFSLNKLFPPFLLQGIILSHLFHFLFSFLSDFSQLNLNCTKISPHYLEFEPPSPYNQILITTQNLWKIYLQWN